MTTRPADRARCAASATGLTPRDESYRATVAASTPDGGECTVVVTRQGHGRTARVWLTTGASVLSTVVLTADEAGNLAELLTTARAAR